MPRRRHRDTDPLVRDRNQLEILGAPGVAGLSRIGSPTRGAGTSLVVRPPAAGGQVRIEHVTLHAQASQTIASGGAGITWDRYADAPTEIRGFATAADQLAATGSIVAIPVDVGGFLVGMIELPFATTVNVDAWKVERIRHGIATTFLSELSGTNIEAVRGPFEGWVEPGDELKFTLDPAADVTLGSPAWLQLGIWQDAPATSRVVEPVITTLHGYGEPASRPTEATVNGTTAIQPGDVLVAFIGSAEPSITSPSGWTNKSQSINGDAVARVDWRVAQAGDDTASWTWSATGGAAPDLSLAVTVVVLRGIHTTSPFDGDPGLVNSGNTTVTSANPTMTSTQTSSLLLLFGWTQNVVTTHAVAGMTQVANDVDGGGDETLSVWRGQASGGAESETLTWDSASSVQAALVALRRA